MPPTASERPDWNAITGIELSLLSARIATDNLARNRRASESRCAAVDVRCGNAIDSAVPPGDLFVTMYNPFVGKTFERCIEHLHEAALDAPVREIWLAYINPWCAEVLEQSGYFQRLQHHWPIARQWAWSLWRHVSSGS